MATAIINPKKAKLVFCCTGCGAMAPKWSGQCGDCGEWNTLVEELQQKASPARERFGGYANAATGQVTLLSEVSLDEKIRSPTGLSEFDHVLGGGLVAGSVVLIGGDPGIGKSTLLLQTLCGLSAKEKALYVTGEESLQQVAMRARRLDLPMEHLHTLSETGVELILQHAVKLQPKVMVIDSIQTVYTDALQSAPGGISQVRESAAKLVRYAKQTGTALFLVGHVTKEGALAGPRVLEHMVDTVLYFEGDRDGRFRIVRAVKNRFGAVNELGVFAMTEKGLRQVSNPSAIFLTRDQQPVPGSVVLVAWEGSRPLLVELQSLVDGSHLGNPRRVTLGLDHNRMAMLLAVLHRHGGIPTFDQDVFVNVVGGVRITETAADLGVLLTVISSLRNNPLPLDLIVFGEVGLSGELRPVQCGQERLREAAKHGFKRAIVPKANAPKKAIPGMDVVAVTKLHEAINAI